MTATLAPQHRHQRPAPVRRPTTGPAYRPSTVRRPTPHRHAPVPAALPGWRELLIAVGLVATAVVSLQLLAPEATVVPAATTPTGELIVTVEQGETLDDVLERIADGPARIDLGEQIVRLNGGAELQAGRQFVLRVD